MKRNLLILVIVVFSSAEINAQVYKFTSDKAMVVKLHSVSPYYVQNDVSITIDIGNKKIIIDSTQKAVFNITSADTTVASADIKMINYKCLDNVGKNRIVVFILYNEPIQNKIGSMGQLAVDNGWLIYTYELYKKI